MLPITPDKLQSPDMIGCSAPAAAESNELVFVFPPVLVLIDTAGGDVGWELFTYTIAAVPEPLPAAAEVVCKNTLVKRAFVR